MNVIGTLIFILQIFLLTTVHVEGKPCSNSSSECQQIRMPLVSNKLNAPLVAELDVTSMNKQLETYIRDNIESTFSENVKDLVKNEQDDLKVSMLQDYSNKLNTTKKGYDMQFSNIVQNLKAKQGELQLEISDVNKTLGESELTFNTKITALLSGFEERQESLKLAMLSDYLSKLQQSQDANKQQINDLETDLKSKFVNLSQELEKELMKSIIHSQTQTKELEEWKINLSETSKGLFYPKIKDCSYLRRRTTNPSGVYTIYLDEFDQTKAFCDMSTDGGGWTVIQRRTDGTTDFNRNWIEYKEGFGDPHKEYWLGNKYLNILTTNGKYELRVELTGGRNKRLYTLYAVYKTFAVSDENSQYKLTIRGYSGNLWNLMSFYNGKKFNTKDRDHDINTGVNCAKPLGGWWHYSCSYKHINRHLYEYSLHFGGSYCIRSSMMIRQIM